MAVPWLKPHNSTYWVNPSTHPSEAFECLDCYLVDHLDIHGRCQRCNSDAVFPFQILENSGRWIRINDIPHWVPIDPKYGREGVIRIRVGPKVAAAEPAKRPHELPAVAAAQKEKVA